MIQLAQKVRSAVDKARSFLRRQWFEQYTSILGLNVDAPEAATQVTAAVKLFDAEGAEILTQEEHLIKRQGKWSTIVTVQSKEQPGSILVVYKITDEQGRTEERLATFTPGDELSVFTPKEQHIGSAILWQKYRDLKGAFGLIRLRRPAAAKSFGEQKHQWYGWKNN